MSTRTDTTPKVAVLFAAKSTADKHESIPTQLADGRKLASERGFDVVSEHQDEDASAFHGNRGPGLAAAMADCERLSAEHGSCAMIVQRSDRLARGDGKQARSLVEVVLWAIKHDVELFSVIDPEILSGGDLALVMGAIGAMKGHGESRDKSASVKAGVRRRAERGDWIGPAPFGYTRAGTHPETGRPAGPLVRLESEARLIERIFEEHLSGVSQRALAAKLTGEGVKSPAGRAWSPSAVWRILANPAYIGKVRCEGELFDGNHEPIIDPETWNRVAATRKTRRSGRPATGGHLLPAGLLRCAHCGDAMTARAGGPGERPFYICRTRFERGKSACDMPRLRRDRVDEPFLRALLDSYVDLAATKRRIEERSASALAGAREAREHAEGEQAKAEAALARVRGHYQEGRLEPDDWAQQRPELEAGAEAARKAAERSSEHVQQIEEGAAVDVEAELLEHLAAVRAAATDTATSAPDLPALRNVIASIFERVEIVRDGEFGPCTEGSGEIAQTQQPPRVEGSGYWLMLFVRSSMIDFSTLEPKRAELPVNTGSPTAPLTNPLL